MKEELERRYHAILKEYANLLQEWGELPKGQEWLPGLLPSFHTIEVLRDSCPLRASPDIIRFLVAPGAQKEGLRELRDFTMGIRRLTIVDPYFFAGKAAEAADIADHFTHTVRVESRTLKAVHIVRNDERDAKAVFTAITRKLRPHGVRFTHSSSKEIHDRVWIGDAQRAVVVGTSFNGLGSRAAFILPLPRPDLDAILEFIYGRGLAHRPRRGGKP